MPSSLCIRKNVAGRFSGAPYPYVPNTTPIDGIWAVLCFTASPRGPGLKTTKTATAPTDLCQSIFFIQTMAERSIVIRLPSASQLLALSTCALIALETASVGSSKLKS